MQLTIERLKAACKRLGYKWYTDRPNLIGIRTALYVPDVFNDLLACVWVQPAPEPGLTTFGLQSFLASFGYVGKNGKPLLLDGKAGENTAYAKAACLAEVGKERMKVWPITTTPGLFYLRNPIAGGTAIVVPGQYPNVWRIGFHQGKSTHPALIQQGGPITIYRDNDRDDIPEEQKATESGYYGINCHGAKREGATVKIWNWSAGCQVHALYANKEEMLGIVGHWKDYTKNFFTYTLLRERELA